MAKQGGRSVPGRGMRAGVRREEHDVTKKREKGSRHRLSRVLWAKSTS